MSAYTRRLGKIANWLPSWIACLGLLVATIAAYGCIQALMWYGRGFEPSRKEGWEVFVLLGSLLGSLVLPIATAHSVGGVNVPLEEEFGGHIRVVVETRHWSRHSGGRYDSKKATSMALLDRHVAS
jgi:hypothetical protein